MEKKILIATHNTNKVREFKEILEPLGYEVISAKDLNIDIDVEENGKTYEENAYIKAKFLANKLNMAVVSDDSGIEIDELGEHFPGINSARWASSISNDYRKVDEHVLSLLKGNSNRKAAYHCSICYLEGKDAFPHFFNGVCEGEIIDHVGGFNGFGYDPIFKSNDLGKCFGDATDEEKNSVSHRSKASKAFIDFLTNTNN